MLFAHQGVALDVALCRPGSGLDGRACRRPLGVIADILWAESEQRRPITSPLTTGPRVRLYHPVRRVLPRRPLPVQLQVNYRKL